MKTQKGSAHSVIIVVIVVALVGALGYVFWKNFIASKQSTIKQSSAKSETKKPVSGIVQLKDGDMNKYVNYEEGFEFLFPKSIYSNNGCKAYDYKYDSQGNKTPSQTHYGGTDGPVDMTVLVDGSEYIMVPDKAVVQSGAVGSDAEGYIYTACNEVPTTIALLNEFKVDQADKNLAIEKHSFIVRDAATKDDALEVVRDILDDPNATVEWQADPSGKSRETGTFEYSQEHEFVGGFKYNLWYYGDEKKVVWINLGQSLFFEHPDHSGQFYTDITSSFKLLAD